ncbi:MAG: hypothetical protein QME66_02760 [Candidatus Eisenbacteria bacterium]|nr:hypothetical protein [Candidatus Eisenbacteria bacterium]
MTVFIYPDTDVTPLCPEALETYLRTLFPNARIELREYFVRFHSVSLPPKEGEEVLLQTAKELALARVRDPVGPLVRREPLFGEIEVEKRALIEGRSYRGILYDGYKLSATFRKLIPAQERRLSSAHIVLTSRLIGTRDKSDRRYHARVSVYSVPSIISTTGVVEAPAKAREYYLIKSRAAALGESAELDEILEELKGEHISYGDERLTDTAKGYVLQAIFYQFSGNPFCEHRFCRLFNAHWQKEMLEAQFGGPYELCPRHAEMLKSFG